MIKLAIEGIKSHQETQIAQDRYTKGVSKNMDDNKYFAFISYNHRDKREAKWLQQRLERYHIPSSLRKEDPTLPRRIRPVFRDVSDLGLGILAEGIDTALRRSQFLIVLCSPAAADSKWVNQEIERFLSIGDETGEDRRRKVIPVIVGRPSHPNRNGQSSDTPSPGPDYRDCLPESLESFSSEKELLAANYFESGRNHAFIKIVARMLGVEPDILWRRYQRYRRGIVIRACTFVLALSAIAFYGYRTMNDRAHSRKIIEKVRSLIDSDDPITAQRLLLSVIPDNNPVKRTEFYSGSVYLLRKAEYAYRNKARIIPGTYSNSDWEFLNDHEIGSVEGIIDVDSGMHSLFPEMIHYGPDYVDHVFTKDGTVLFFAEKGRIMKYDIPSGQLTELFTVGDLQQQDLCKAYDKYITSISLLKNHRLGVTFSVGVLEDLDGYETALLACLMDSDGGELKSCFYYPILEEGKDNAYSFVSIHVDDAGQRAYLFDCEGREFAYNLVSGDLLGQTGQFHQQNESRRITSYGVTTPDGQNRAVWASGKGVVIRSGSLDSVDPYGLDHLFVLKGDSLLVCDKEGNRLSSAYCPFPLSETCHEIQTRTPDPGNRRTLFFSPARGSGNSGDYYVYDWLERTVTRVFYSSRRNNTFYWSKQGNALVIISIAEQHPYMGFDGKISIVPFSSSAISLDDRIWFYHGWPVSPDASYVCDDESVYSIDSGELLHSLDEHVDYYLSADGCFFYFTESALNVLDLVGGQEPILIHMDVFGSDNSTSGIIDVSPDRHYMVLGNDYSHYQVISLDDGRVVLRIPPVNEHLLTNEAFFSFKEDIISGWSLRTGEKLFERELPISAQSAIGNGGEYSIGISPLHEYVLLASNGQVCVFDALTGDFIDVVGKDLCEGIFESSETCYNSEDQLLSRIRGRYRHNSITKDEIEALLSE